MILIPKDISFNRDFDQIIEFSMNGNGVNYQTIKRKDGIIKKASYLFSTNQNYRMSVSMTKTTDYFFISDEELRDALNNLKYMNRFFIDFSLNSMNTIIDRNKIKIVRNPNKTYQYINGRKEDIDDNLNPLFRIIDYADYQKKK